MEYRSVLIRTALTMLVLANFFVETSYGVVVPGTTIDDFTIGSTGTAQDRIAVQVPPGTAGMAPTLSLSYDSASGNGLLGVGWAIGGLSAITRCPATQFQDGFFGGINFDANDRFCLDGQRLIAIAGVYGAEGTEYRTEIDGLTKIVSHTSSTTTGGPAWFTVWTKTGQIMEYGNTTDSRIEAVLSTAARVWALNKISDSSGNYQSYSYNEDTVNGSYWPSRIDYTGNAGAGLSPYNSVRFTYEATRPDKVLLYQAGYPIKTTQRLIEINTYVGSSLVKSYRLTYESSGTSRRSRLTSVTECGSSTGVSADTCYPPTKFSFDDDAALAIVGQAYFGSAPAKSWYSTTTGFGGNGWNHTFVDLNGDGLPDYVRYYNSPSTASKGTRVYVNLNTGSGFDATGSPDYQVWDNTTSGYGANGWKQSFIDMNGDGLPDYVRHYIEPTANANGGNGTRVRVNFNVGGTGFDTANTQVWDNSTGTSYGLGWSHTFIDMNGDGLPDYVRYYNSPVAGGNTQVRVRLNTGSGFDPYTIWDNTASGYGGGFWSQGFIDINGDGLPDYIRKFVDATVKTGDATTIVHVRLNTGTKFAANMQLHSGKEGILLAGGPFTATFIDMNGDKLLDYVRYGITQSVLGISSAFVRVSLNTGKMAPGKTFGDTQIWSSDSGYNTSWHQTFADMNGDKLPDYVRYWMSPSGTGSQAFVNYNTGSGFSGRATIDNTTTGYNITWQQAFIDLNGDTLPDYIRFWKAPAGSSTGTKVRVNLNNLNNGSPDKIHNIT